MIFQTKEHEKCPRGRPPSCWHRKLFPRHGMPGLEVEALALGPALESEDLIFLWFKTIVNVAILILLSDCKGQR